MRRLAILLSFLTTLTIGQVPTSAERWDRIDNFMQTYLDAGRLNGAVIMIEKDGHLVYHNAYGFADVGTQTEMREDHIFRIASMTKPIISVGVMMLYEEGLFSLDDPVSRFIPEFANPAVVDTYNSADTTYTTREASREITIRDLLSHTSGLGYAQIGDAMANGIYFKNRINGGIGTPYSPLSEMIPKLARLPLMQEPGSGFLYGLNTDVLGYFIEVVSGERLDNFLRKRIFEPLGMTDTYFYLPSALQDRLVPLYVYDDQLRVQDSLIDLHVTFHRDYPLYPDGEYFSGGAGLSSTAADYMKFAAMLQAEGRVGNKYLLAPSTVAMMHKNYIGSMLMWGDAEMRSRFGLGFGIFTAASERATGIPEGSYGWSGMYASHFWVDPVNDVTVVIMRNIWPTPDWDLQDRIAPIIYQAVSTLE
jgi:CubicO group peptidase (beta-lactamase class C family)